VEQETKIESRLAWAFGGYFMCINFLTHISLLALTH